MATAHKMGIQSVACYSDADRHSMHVAMVSTKASWKNPKILINLLRGRLKKLKAKCWCVHLSKHLLVQK